MTSAPNFKILIATHNLGKVREVRQALQSLPVTLVSLSDFAHVSLVKEVGRTYEENAVLKALSYAEQTGLCALADDSGLEVDALGGEPGVLSARFAGEDASDSERIQKLLTALNQRGNEDRSARFVCCMALAGWERTEDAIDRSDPRLLTVAEAKCEGVIAGGPRGANGFGFDPIFVPTGYDTTFAELPSEVKARISHRALAFSAIRTSLSQWIA